MRGRYSIPLKAPVYSYDSVDFLIAFSGRADRSRMSEEASVRERHIEWLRRAAARHQVEDEERVARGWQVAQRAARLLHERYGVTRVRVFGSLVHPRQFHAGSDVDLAVEGLAASNYWDALAEVLFLDDAIGIDLVDAKSCPPVVWEIVEREGVDL